MQFKDYIEDFCIKRFQMNAAKGKAALEEALDRVYEETREQITDIIRDVTGIPLQPAEPISSHGIETAKQKTAELVFLE